MRECDECGRGDKGQGVSVFVYVCGSGVGADVCVGKPRVYEGQSGGARGGRHLEPRAGVSVFGWEGG